MRVAVLGGTRFIGRAIVDDLIANGHDVLVVHRGSAEPPGLPELPHVHVARRELDSDAAQSAIRDFRPDAFVDTCAITGADALFTLDALPNAGDLRLLVLSSVDVYDAYGGVHEGEDRAAVPCYEDSPVRAKRYPYRGLIEGMDDYDKLDVEEAWVPRGGTVVRLPMVYGPWDYQRREEFVLKRVRAGRTRIPCGSGQWLSCRGAVGELARGVRLALESESAAGEIFNLCERGTWSARRWAEEILRAAGSPAELVRVPDDALPEDLGELGPVPQHLLTDASKAKHVLGWVHADPATTVKTSVEWHLEHPPEGPVPDWSADDKALEAASVSGAPADPRSPS